MATLHCVTASTVATVTNQEAVKELFDKHEVYPLNFRLEGGKLQIHGDASFIVQDEDGEECTAEFLNQLQQYLDEGEELVIQTVGNEKWRYPLVVPVPGYS